MRHYYIHTQEDESLVKTVMAYLKNIEIRGDEVRCEVISSDILSKEEKLRLKGVITQRVGEEIRVLVSFWYRQINHTNHY